MDRWVCCKSQPEQTYPRLERRARLVCISLTEGYTDASYLSHMEPNLRRKDSSVFFWDFEIVPIWQVNTPDLCDISCVPVPIWLCCKANYHAYSNSQKSKPSFLNIETMAALEYDGEYLKSQVEDAQDECVPGHSVSQWCSNKGNKRTIRPEVMPSCRKVEALLTPEYINSSKHWIYLLKGV